jgi:hypothetical protein
MGKVSKNIYHSANAYCSPRLVALVDTIKQGVKLAVAARSLIKGGFSMQKIDDIKQLIASAHSFFKALSHRNQPDGLGEETFVEDWKSEGKDVWMFSGKRTFLT